MKYKMNQVKFTLIMRKNMKQSYTFLKPFYWVAKDQVGSEGSKFNVLAFCHDQHAKVVTLNVGNYEPWIHLVLPDNLADSQAENVCREIFGILKKKLAKDDHSPTRYESSFRLPYYYYNDQERICIKLHFETEDAARHCGNLCKWPVYTDSYGPLKLIYAEDKIDQLAKFHGELNLRPCDWIEVPVRPILYNESVHLSTEQDEFDVSWKEIRICTEAEQDKLGPSHPSFMVFDSEMGSHRKYAFPDELNARDPIFMTGVLHIWWNDDESKYMIDEYCLVYHPTIKKEDVGDIPNTLLERQPDSTYKFKSATGWITLMWYNEELELCDGLEHLIAEKNPDGVIGHNSNAFDFKYHKVRKARMHEPYNNMSRLKNWNQNFKHIEWFSSAYRDIILDIPDGHGRIYFDTMLMAKRDYKCDSYGLDALCQQYMGIGKHEWSVQAIFDSFYGNDPEALRNTIIYCMRDVWCTWGLFNHLNFWVSYSGMSNVIGIGIFELFTEGQGIRTRTQVFKECFNEGYYLHSPERIQRSIAGGHVFPQIPGIYEWLLLIDFAGLYPSIMRAFNISNDTYDIAKRADDKDCHIFKWEDKHGDWETRFVKDYIRKGLVPKILEKLAKSRTESKAKMAACKKAGDEVGTMNNNVEQNAKKISMNSIYGGLAQKGGYLGLEEAGATVTAVGRMLVQKAGKWAVAEGWEVVYGDSVTGQTPILLRIGGIKQIFTMTTLFNTIQQPITYDTGKEYHKVPECIDVWTEKGWTQVHNIMRHKTTKKIYRITTKTGYVEVTEDHSLLRNTGESFTPNEAKVGDKMMVSYPSDSLYMNEIERSKDHNNMSIHILCVCDTQYDASVAYYHMRKNLVKQNRFKDPLYESNYDDHISVEYYKNNGKDQFKVFVANNLIENCSEIISIEQIYTDSQDGQYVYDLTTENHHFQAGIGGIIVHNTDSVMVRRIVPLTEHEKIHFDELGKVFVKKMNDECFTYPIVMELDGCFRTFETIAPKMYTYVLWDPKNPLSINEKLWNSKGLVTSRRDSCKMIRRLYKRLAVMTGSLYPIEDVIVFVCDEIERLVRGPLDIEEMVTIKVLGSDYKSENNPLAIFSRHLHDIGMNVKPGDRLPYVYKKVIGGKGVGCSYEDPEVFLREKCEYDRIMYLKSQFANKLDSLLHVSYPTMIPESLFSKVPDLIGLKPNVPIVECIIGLMRQHANI